MYLPPPKKCKFLRFWMERDALVAKDRKSCELHEMAILNESEPHYGEKPAK